jgi:hypothetical protein
MMFVSRLTFHTIPGKTGEVEHALKQLRDMVVHAGGSRPRILHTHFASLGAPDVVFEQDVSDLTTLETQMAQLTSSPAFQQWSGRMSGLLSQSPKRELYLVAD